MMVEWLYKVAKTVLAMLLIMAQISILTSNLIQHQPDQLKENMKYIKVIAATESGGCSTIKDIRVFAS